MSNAVFTSDLKILFKLYAPKIFKVEVWDPNGKVVKDESYDHFASLENPFKILVYIPSTEEDYSGCAFSEFDLILDFSKTLNSHLPFAQNVNYVNNPEGKMRWMYSDHNRKATFLKFYNASTWRSKSIGFGIKVAFLLRLQALVRSGSYQVQSKKVLKLDKLLQEIPHKDYTVFLGSEGDNRTVLLETNAHNVSTHFLKIPITQVSQHSVANEKNFLQRLPRFSFRSFQFPEIVGSQFKDVLVTKALNSPASEREIRFTKQHAAFLSEISEKTTQFTVLENASYWKLILDQVAQLSIQKTYSKEVDLILQLKEELQNVKGVFTCLSHGDFTPWNMYHSTMGLKVYDWEMAKDQMPQLFDLFHYHFQTGVLVNQYSYAQIKKAIFTTCAAPKINAIISKFHLDVNDYLRLYILKAASIYFVEFQGQKKLNIQNNWLAKALKEALLDCCTYENENHRQVFMADLNERMQTESHAYLKLLEPNVIWLPTSSDLDILIAPGSVNTMVSFCKNHTRVERVSVYRKSFMTTLEVYFKDHGFLAIDFITEFKRKSLQLMNPKAVLNSATKNAFGFYIPDPVFDLEYAYLFYQLNGASLPIKYQNHFLNLEYNSPVNKMPEHLQLKYGLCQFSMEELFEAAPSIKIRLEKQLKGMDLNRGLKRLSNGFNYLIDTVSDIVSRQGLVITFSGVDGAGKTTVIGKVKHNLEEKYRKDVILLRHRPGILPILSALKHGKKEAEQIASVTLPRKGTNASVLSSLARFAYYFTDYMVGQVYVYFKYTLRGKVVLYDRYYFDFINDAKRSNIQLNRKFVKALYVFVFKPDLNFFLYADAATILSRKQEMMAEEIERISTLYQDLFAQMNQEQNYGVYSSIENKYLENTLSKVWQSYQKVA